MTDSIKWQDRNDSFKQEFTANSIVKNDIYCNINTLVENTINNVEGEFYEEYLAEICAATEQFELSIYGSYTEYTREELEKEIEERENSMHPLKPEEDLEALETLQTGLENGATSYNEIFEWWAISNYLAKQLKEQGYCIIEIGCTQCYGRPTTGQALCLDNNLQDIAKSHYNAQNNIEEEKE